MTLFNLVLLEVSKKDKLFGIMQLTLLVLKLSIFFQDKKFSVMLAIWDRAVKYTFPFRVKYIKPSVIKNAQIPKLNRKEKRNLVKKFRKGMKK